jgi:hypothetical protein
LVAAAALMNLGFIAVAPLVLFELWRAQGTASRRKRLIFAVGGGAAVCLAIFLWLGLAGALDDMRSQMFAQATEAVSGDLTGGTRRGLFEFPLAFLALSLTGLAGCAAAWFDRRLRTVAFSAGLWILVMMVRVKLTSNVGGQHHYPALPGVAAGIALGIKVIVDRATARWHWNRLRPVLAAALLAIPVVAYIVVPQVRQLRIPADQRWGGDTSLRLAYPVSRFVEGHTRPEEKIFVAGSDAEVYWLSRRDASTRFFHSYPLRWNPEFHVERRRDLLESPPAAIVIMPGAGGR